MRVMKIIGMILVAGVILAGCIPNQTPVTCAEIERDILWNANQGRDQELAGLNQLYRDKGWAK